MVYLTVTAGFLQSCSVLVLLVLSLSRAACKMQFHLCRTTLRTGKSWIYVADEEGTAAEGHQGVSGKAKQSGGVRRDSQHLPLIML
jgi:hypothetical protein